MSDHGTSDAAAPVPAGTPTLDGSPGETSPGDESRVAVQTARLGRFVLLRELGSGGMGSVFAAYDEHLDRKVALKILHSAHAGTEEQRGRALREARAAARVSHPNVIGIYEVGEIAGSIHIAMEHVDGGTLRSWQADRRRTWREILEMYLQVGEGLLAAHQAEVVHRDFKPDNVLIDWDERPRVVDFGLARLGWGDDEAGGSGGGEQALPEMDAKTSERLTLPGVISGTPGYMSPEQYRGGNVDSRSDQWSFCAALYEALYEQLPFSGSTLREHANSVLGPPGEPPPGSQVPADIRQVLLRGLSPNPEQRFPSMEELIERLRRELLGDATSGALSRQRFSRGLVIAAIVGLVFFQLRYAQLSLKPRAVGPIWVGILAMVLLGGLWYREVLSRSRFHRHIWFTMLTCAVACLLQRYIGYLHGMALPELFPFQMVVIGAFLAVLAALLLPELFLVLPIPLLASVLSIQALVPHRLLSLVYPLTAIGLVICWSRAAGRAQRRPGAIGADAPSSVRGRRTLSRPGYRASNDRLRRLTPDRPSAEPPSVPSS